MAFQSNMLGFLVRCSGLEGASEALFQGKRVVVGSQNSEDFSKSFR